MRHSNTLVRAALAAAPTADRPLPAAVADRIARAARVEAATIRLAPPGIAARLTEAACVPAFEAGGVVFLHPRFSPEAPSSLGLLAHEAAHVLQRRRVASPGAWDAAPSAEADADDLARAVLRGHSWQPRHAGPCPPLQPGWPAIVLLLLAAGVLTGIGSYQAAQTEAAQVAQGARPEPLHLHETAWGFIPFVGSIDQILNGDNLWSKAGGAVFLVLDCTLLGGIAARGLVRGGVIFSTRSAVREGIAAAARGEGTAAQRDALGRLTAMAASGEITLGSHAAMERSLMAYLAGTRGPVIISGSTGWRNHTVTYLVRNGFFWKLHGGASRFAYPITRPQYIGLLRREWLRQFNRVSIYAGEGLLTDAALHEQARFWGRYQSGFVNQALNFLFAPGCAGSSAVLLERLGLHGAGAPARYIPYLLDRSRMAGPYGAHFLVNRWRGMIGSAIHAGGLLSLAGMYLGGHAINTPAAQEIYFGHNVDRGEMDAALIEPADGLDLMDAGGYDGFGVTWPGELTFSAPDPAAIRLIEGGGAVMPMRQGAW